MMLRERGWVVAVLGIGLAMTPSQAPGQAAGHKPKTVQPDQGPPPDQAEQPDVSTQLPAGQQEQFPQPNPAPPTPPPEPAPEPESAPKVEAPPDAAAAPTPAPAPAPPPAVLAKTPEGRQLQQETALLLQLAQDLKTELQKAGNNTLSLAALRKVQEIQKMSKSLKEEMNRQEQGTQGK